MMNRNSIRKYAYYAKPTILNEILINEHNVENTADSISLLPTRAIGMSILSLTVWFANMNFQTSSGYFQLEG